MCARLRRTLTALGIAILLRQSSDGLSAQRIANGKQVLYKPMYLMHTRETRRILLHQARGMSGGSKNITRDFLLHSHVYFISISVHVGIFNYVLYINTCNFVVGWNRETSIVTLPDPCQGVKKNVCAASAHTHGSRYSDSPTAVQRWALCSANCQWKIGVI